MMNKSPDALQRNANYLYSVIVGLFVPLVSTRIVRMSSAFDNWYFPVVVLIYFLAALILIYRSQHNIFAQMVIVYLLLPVGSFLDAAVDHFFYGSGRNLWGLEVITLLILVPFPLFLGALIGRHLAHGRSNQNN